MPEKLLCASSDLSDTTVKICEVDGVEIGIIRHNGDVVAYKNVCPHQGGPVCEGLRMPRVCVEFDDQQRALQQNFDERVGEESHLRTVEFLGTSLGSFVATPIQELLERVFKQPFRDLGASIPGPNGT